MSFRLRKPPFVGVVGGFALANAIKRWVESLLSNQKNNSEQAVSRVLSWDGHLSWPAVAGGLVRFPGA